MDIRAPYPLYKYYYLVTKKLDINYEFFSPNQQNITLSFFFFRELEALGKELEHLSHIKESVEDKVFAYDIISLCVLYWFIDHLCINFFSY